MILDRYSSHLIFQFDRICAENNIILLYIFLYLFYLLQLLDIGYFAALKYIYSHFVSDLARTGYNHIDKFDFLADYLCTRIEVFQSNIVHNSFAAIDIVPVDANQILSKLNISLRIPLPLSSRPSSSSSQFTPKMSRTVAQLRKQTKIIKDLIDRRSKSSPSPLKLVVDQILKGHYQALHHTALLVKENADLHAANEKNRQKRLRSTRQNVHKGGLSIEEGLQLAQQPIQPVEADKVGSHEEVDLSNQPIQPARRALSTCSGCGQIGHRITSCKNRII